MPRCDGGGGLHADPASRRADCQWHTPAWCSSAWPLARQMAIGGSGPVRAGRDLNGLAVTMVRGLVGNIAYHLARLTILGGVRLLQLGA